MKRKNFFILISLFGIAIAVFILWFLYKSKSPTNINIDKTTVPCLIFQSEDSSRPCFREGSGGVSTGTNIPTNIQTTTPSVPVDTKNTLIQQCFSENSIEVNGCISNVAQEKKDPFLCSYIRGSYSQAQCKDRITNPTNQVINTKIIDTKPSSYNPFIEVPTTINTVSTTSTNNLDQITTYIEKLKNDALNDKRVTPDGFYERMQTLVPVALYAFSEYQMKPGTELVAQGSGFSKSGNTIHIGSYEIPNLGSSDGMNISFTLPQNVSLGTYETWVTNERGTSKKDNQPIKVVVTQNPAPRPAITSISPLVPTLDDVVTISGQNFAGAVGLYTSFGVLNHFSATNSSVSFKISDFDLVSKIKDLPTVKGKVLQVSLIIGTPQGFNKEMFNFGVQF